MLSDFQEHAYDDIYVMRHRTRHKVDHDRELSVFTKKSIQSKVFQNYMKRFKLITINKYNIVSVLKLDSRF